MLEQKGFDRGSIITGSSVQNQCLISAVVETLLMPEDIIDISILVDKNFTMNATRMVIEVSHKNSRYQYNICTLKVISIILAEMYGQPFYFVAMHPYIHREYYCTLG